MMSNNNGKNHVSLPTLFRRAPRVISTVPANGAVGVNPTAGVTINMNKTCAVIGFTTNPVHAPGWMGIFVAGGFSLTLTPDAPGLAALTLYTVTVTATSQHGRTLPGGSYVFSFTTA